ncbi:BatA domain-containing protein [Hymenobacter sp. BT186]|uniref:BatA domain-containing protein n=1 Tax=Hymenobacter telluris TaxID=2816474 RepID=A0A939ETT1_9BACT|nr:BatA domain-containing protein [Hymenobacter telluris]MBO0357659.1 BatA domain-containing protein [Hymenobacter telluris]MBW3373686.1 BatA domain-containing protein [Hymenobacter norwichensis]
MYSVTSFLLANTTAGLLALLGLAVPVAIHLWNRRPGQTVQVGSVRWLVVGANRRLRNLQLEQLWLLLLRAAIVALLALAVAGPLWQRFQNSRAPRGIVLLAPEALRPEVLPALRPTVDSLRRQGFALRLFAPGFRVVSGRAWASPDSLAKLTAPPVPAASSSVPPPPPDNYWHRARQAADSFPDQPLRIVAGTALRHFSGPRPALPAQLKWQPVPLPDSMVWLAGAAFAGTDTLRLLLGRSREEATTFQTVLRPVPRAAGSVAVPGLPALPYQPGTTGRPATLRQPGQPAVAVLPGPLRVMLYTDALHAESGRYVRAALQAASIGLMQGLEIRTASAETTFSTSPPPDWLFWLSEKPAPASWQAQVPRGAQLWQEATGTGAAVQTELDLAGLAVAPPIAITRLDTTIQRKTRTALVWQDGTGRPVLTHHPNGAGGLYQLQTRLQPAWSGLPDSPALPELLLQLLRPVAPPTYATHDARQLDATQLTSFAQPDTSRRAAPSAASRKAGPKVQTTELRAWVVLAALVLFALERWLARRGTLTPSVSAA